MKITAGRLESFLRQPDPALKMLLVYGPDQGLVRENADRLARCVLEDLRDPFCSVEISGADLKSDPARLYDEANAMSLTGGGRVVRIREATDSLGALFKEFLADGKCEALILIEAGALKAQSSLRKVFEGAENAAAIPCYEDDHKSLRQVIGETLGKYELSPTSDALDLLVESLGADRMLSRSELEKLALFMGTSGTVTVDDVQACVGESAASSLDAVVNAAFNGDRPALERELTRAFTEGVVAVSLLRAIARHLQRLHLARAYVSKGNSPQQAMRFLKPPVFFKQADNFRRQMQNWSEDKISTALEMVTEAEIDCKSTGFPEKAICSRTFMRITQAARRH